MVCSTIYRSLRHISEWHCRQGFRLRLLAASRSCLLQPTWILRILAEFTLVLMRIVSRHIDKQVGFGTISIMAILSICQLNSRKSHQRLRAKYLPRRNECARRALPTLRTPFELTAFLYYYILVFRSCVIETLLCITSVVALVLTLLFCKYLKSFQGTYYVSQAFIERNEYISFILCSGLRIFCTIDHL